MQGLTTRGEVGNNMTPMWHTKGVSYNLVGHLNDCGVDDGQGLDKGVDFGRRWLRFRAIAGILRIYELWLAVALELGEWVSITGVFYIMWYQPLLSIQGVFIVHPKDSLCSSFVVLVLHIMCVFVKVYGFRFVDVVIGGGDILVSKHNPRHEGYS